MTEADCPRVFARVLYDMIGEVFAAHGLDALYEDEIRSIVHECVERAYPQSIIEWYLIQGLPPSAVPSVGRAVWGAASDAMQPAMEVSHELSGYRGRGVRRA